MSYVNPTIRPQLESLSIELKNEILSRDVRIEKLTDLVAILESIASAPESTP